MNKSLIFLAVLITSMLSSSTELNGQIDTRTLIDSLDTYLRTKKYPGLMLSVVTSDSILVSKGIGYSNVATKKENNENTLFRQGSISKSFTALALIKVLNDKNLSLNTPIKEIDPSIPIQNKWNLKTSITVSHLLEHTTGFDGWHTHAIYNTTDSIAPSTKELVNSHRKSLTSRWEPGTIHAYNNPSYVLAGHLIEVLSQIPYHEYIRNEILIPLGMESSAFHFNNPRDVAIANGYDYKNGDYSNIPFVKIQGGPAGNLCSNASDMTKYLQFMLNRNGKLIDQTIFTDQMFERIENPRTTSVSKYGIKGGYGLGNFSVEQKGYEFHGHNGGIDGSS